MSFRFRTDVSLRYDDLDTYGHVNNARYVTYLEEARIEYFEEVIGDSVGEDLLSATSDGVGIVVAALELDFERPVRATDSVDVGVRVPKLGETSLPFEYEIRDGEGVVATGETTVVAYDRDAGASQPLPENWRDAITRFEDL